MCNTKQSNTKIRRDELKAASFALILSVLVSAMPAAAGSAKKDIVDTAAAAGTFNTLATALQAAGLADTLKGSGPFTVFAPTDEAFSKLPAGTVESLLKPENKERLKAILLYHVVSGDVTAAQVVKLSSAKTINGQDLKLTVNDGTVRVNDSKVVKADVLASNGVIHVIDTVLLPKD
jgi:uncharacterized surface protein with fasciclin (FAS1) repeats